MQYLIPIVLALSAIAAAFVFSTSIATLFRLTKKHSTKTFWIGLTLLLGAIPVITDMRAVRGGIDEDNPYGGWTPPGYVSFLSEWSSKGITYVILVYAVIQIILNLKFRSIQKNPGASLYLAYLGLVIPILISGFAGTLPYFSQFLLFAPLIFTLVYLKRPDENWKWYSSIFRYILLIYLILSGISGITAPDITTSPALPLISGFNFRLNGIFSHSNTLAMVALGYLILDFSNKRIRNRYDYIATALAIVILILTQSKTTIICAIFSFIIFFLARTTSKINAKNTGFFSLGVVTFIFLALPIILGALLLFTLNTDLLGEHLNNQTFKSLSTLTGRTNIWAITLDSWRESPVFGYGPSLWSVEYRLKYAPQYALVVGMAHNQAIQTLGESGLLGLAGLTIYCIVLLKYGFEFFKETNGASLAFIGSFIIRGISETPFRHIAIDVMFFIHFAFFVIFLSLIREKHRANFLEKI